MMRSARSCARLRQWDALSVGNGFDFHPLEAGRKLVLGGVEIKHDKDSAGIRCGRRRARARQRDPRRDRRGRPRRHFPDNDPKYKNADSIALLSTVWKLAIDQGCSWARRPDIFADSQN